MLVHVPSLLSPAALQICQRVLESARWEDGRATAGHQSSRVKHNEQLPEQGKESRQLQQLVLEALEASPLFISAALPQRVFPPLFNRYREGMGFGSHVDNAVRQLPGSAQKLRTDLSATLFLTPPERYQGGELVIEDTYGSHSVKLAAGDLVLYPSSSLHHVTPVTSGERCACFFWVQSMVRDASERGTLFDLDMALIQLREQKAGGNVDVLLTGVYHNLLRRWASP